MQFTRLRLTGFKSFVEPSELRIESGLTGVVGPNGCGKSNLVEALRWVMGETSAKQMRGGEMDDVIFNGTTTRPARQFAEVTLSVDNQSRRAPAAFNDADDLDIVRRIDRGHGSAYRINGKEVRAKDVQILFADLATGAHSPSLVGQGRIARIINAKPVERRALLEDAAGIAGLQSRRHEAELRLKAAEANLARLDDVLATLDTQRQGLAKQARQAQRYRAAMEQIRVTEALLLALRWQQIEVARTAVGELMEAAELAVAQSAGAAAQASRAQLDAAERLPGLRRLEAEAGAELQRLNHARIELDAEARRIAEGASATAERIKQIDADIARERALAGDAQAALAKLAEERESLLDSADSEPEQLEEIGMRVDDARAAVEEADAALTDLTRALATAEAGRAGLDRRAEELEVRRGKLDADWRTQAQIRDRLQAEIAASPRASLDLIDVAEERHALAQETLDHAAERRLEGERAERAAVEAGQQASAAVTQLRAEMQGLEKLLAQSAGKPGGGKIPAPALDAVRAIPGYESALAAALGEDLSASLDPDQPARWEVLATGWAPPPLPGGLPALADFVTAPPALAARLAQIAVATDAASAEALRGQLANGQRLVTRAGDLYRWDGLVRRAGAGGIADQTALRLTQRNRLAALEDAFVAAEARAEESAALREKARDALRLAISAEQQAREAERAAAREIDRVREEQSRLAAQEQARANRLAQLEEQVARLESELEQVELTAVEIDDQRAALPDLGDLKGQIADGRARLAEVRGRLVTEEGARDRLLREAEHRRHRLAAIDTDCRSWTARASGTDERLADLDRRRSLALNERDRLAEAPLELEEKRAVLAELTDSAETRRRDLADRLAEAETALAAADRAVKAATSAAAEAREARVRAEAEVERVRHEAGQLAERVRERLDLAPHELAAAAGLAEMSELPPADGVQAKLDRLMRERDGIGPVNLRAEEELAELDARLGGLAAEKDDLIAAIARLRGGISSLNREGRERLLAAFERVNTSFQDLFTRLFGGGRATLELTEADDPLAAGLEIMASPPGKKLSSLSLLSGGEQALTALALIFAVFQTNPSPICVLDEVDAPLDDANVDRFCTLLEEIAESTGTRFLVITHHRLTMTRMHRLFGVTMAERGISQLVSVDLTRAEALRATA